MAEVVLKNVKKIYPIDDSEKKKKDDQGEQKKTNLQITDKGVVAVKVKSSQAWQLLVAVREVECEAVGFLTF